MSALPPRRRLARVVRALARHLPGQLAGLLEHDRFADGRAALGRLSAEAAAEAAIAALSPDEAAALADRLLARWAQIGTVTLDPDAAILAPDELWIGDAPLKVVLELQVVDAEPGWEAIWDGATAAADPARAVAVASPPPGDEPAVLAVRAHVRARTAAGRVALVAAARIALRRPRVIIDDDRRRVIVTDQAGRPAAGVRLAIGGDVHVTGPGGLVELAAPAAPELPVRVEDILAGRTPAVSSFPS